MKNKTFVRSYKLLTYFNFYSHKMAKKDLPLMLNMGLLILNFSLL